MNKRNYAKELDRIIQRRNGEKPSVLIQSCCGPCSSSVMEFMTQYFDVTILWFNPNLFPEEEFLKRYMTQLEIIRKMGLDGVVKVISEPWQHEKYISAVRGLETCREGGERCAACFRVRLEECARVAKEHNFDYFCSTLTVSRHKNAELINSIGEEIAAETGVNWLPSDFKKHDGENRSVELSEQYGIYRQIYCGCEYSLAARLAGKDPDGEKEDRK